MKITIKLLLLFFTTIVFGQSKILFAYDKAGNQTDRSICLSNCNNVGKNSDGIIAEKTGVLQYYPNPVKEELTIKYSDEKGTKIDKILLFNMAGQQLAFYGKTANGQEIKIPFVNYQMGYYNLVVHYSNGKQQALKIIKN
jgi:hypothetical protein